MEGIRIQRCESHGWEDAFRLSNGLVEVVAVATVGPRIMELRRVGGNNLFHVRPGEAGGRGESGWRLRGGWRLWVAPETETTYEPDNDPCEVREGSDGLLLVGSVPPGGVWQKSVRIRLVPGQAAVFVECELTNVSKEARTGAAWSIPVLRSGSRAFLPLDVGPASAWASVRRPILWSYARMADPRYRWGDARIEVDGRRIASLPVSGPSRREDESKIGTDTAQGWAAAVVGEDLLVKRFPHDPQGTYPDGGATVEVYSCSEFLELENLGPLTTVPPGGRIRLRESWWLFPAPEIPEDEPGCLAALRPLLAGTCPASS